MSNEQPLEFIPPANFVPLNENNRDLLYYHGGDGEGNEQRLENTFAKIDRLENRIAQLSEQIERQRKTISEILNASGVQEHEVVKWCADMRLNDAEYKAKVDAERIAENIRRQIALKNS